MVSVDLRDRPLRLEDAAALGRFMRHLTPEMLPLIARAKVAFGPGSGERQMYERFLERAGLADHPHTEDGGDDG